MCTEVHAQVATLTGVGIDDGAVATKAVRRKTGEHGARYMKADKVSIISMA